MINRSTFRPTMQKSESPSPPPPVFFLFKKKREFECSKPQQFLRVFPGFKKDVFADVSNRNLMQRVNWDLFLSLFFLFLFQENSLILPKRSIYFPPPTLRIGGTCNSGNCIILHFIDIFFGVVVAMDGIVAAISSYLNRMGFKAPRDSVGNSSWISARRGEKKAKQRRERFFFSKGCSAVKPARTEDKVEDKWKEWRNLLVGLKRQHTS